MKLFLKVLKNRKKMKSRKIKKQQKLHFLVETLCKKTAFLKEKFF